MLQTDDITDNLQGKPYFTVINLKDRYLQIFVKEQDIFKAAFTTDEMQCE